MDIMLNKDEIMGVDAEMFVRISGKENHLSIEDVRQLSYEIGGAIGSNVFFPKNPQSKIFKGQSRGNLSIIEPFVDEYNEAPELIGDVVWFQDGDPIIAEKDEQFIKVNLYGRYYGVGYERGSWPNLKACIDWLQCRIPVGQVWYGGDSSGMTAKACTTSYISELQSHWANNGRRPYTRYASNLRMPDYRKGVTVPVCELCDVKMAETGGSMNYAFYWCEGCGQKAVSHKVGKIHWVDEREEWPWLDDNGDIIEKQKANT